MIKSLTMIGLGCLIVIGVYAADGIRQVIGGTDTVGSVGLANLPTGVLTNNQSTVTTIKNDLLVTNGILHVPVSTSTTASITNDSGAGISLRNNQVDIFQSGANKVSFGSSGLYYIYNSPIILGLSSDLGISRNGAAGVMLVDGQNNSFSALQFGGGTGAYSALVTTNTSGIAVKTATGAAFTNLTAQVITATAGFSSSARNLLAPIAITVGASPFNWTNSSASAGGGTNIVEVYIDGVSVTGTVAINGTTVFNTIGQNTIRLQPGEYTTITYTLGTPTATFKNF